MQVGDAGQTTGGRGVSDVVLKIDSARFGMGGANLSVRHMIRADVDAV
jgi:hypothetical protein